MSSQDTFISAGETFICKNPQCPCCGLVRIGEQAFDKAIDSAGCDGCGAVSTLTPIGVRMARWEDFQRKLLERRQQLDLRAPMVSMQLGDRVIETVYAGPVNRDTPSAGATVEPPVPIPLETTTSVGSMQLVSDAGLSDMQLPAVPPSPVGSTTSMATTILEPPATAAPVTPLSTGPLEAVAKRKRTLPSPQPMQRTVLGMVGPPQTEPHLHSAGSRSASDCHGSCASAEGGASRFGGGWWRRDGGHQGGGRGWFRSGHPTPRPPLTIPSPCCYPIKTNG